jgi:hypothetical protein
MAASGHGTVLSVDARHRTLEVVDSSHIVHAYKYQGRLPRLHAGSRISFQRGGKSVSHVKAGGGSSYTVAFYGRVARSGLSGLVLRLADGRTVRFSSKQVRHQRPKPAQRHKRQARFALIRSALASVTINFQGRPDHDRHSGSGLDELRRGLGRPHRWVPSRGRRRCHLHRHRQGPRRE